MIMYASARLWCVVYIVLPYYELIPFLWSINNLTCSCSAKQVVCGLSGKKSRYLQLIEDLLTASESLLQQGYETLEEAQAEY
jgi:hypothetical protein